MRDKQVLHTDGRMENEVCVNNVKYHQRLEKILIGRRTSKMHKPQYNIGIATYAAYTTQQSHPDICIGFRNSFWSCRPHYSCYFEQPRTLQVIYNANGATCSRQYVWFATPNKFHLYPNIDRTTDIGLKARSLEYHSF